MRLRDDISDEDLALIGIKRETLKPCWFFHRWIFHRQISNFDQIMRCQRCGKLKEVSLWWT